MNPSPSQGEVGWGVIRARNNQEVVPAKAGISVGEWAEQVTEVPAFAGMTLWGGRALLVKALAQVDAVLDVDF